MPQSLNDRLFKTWEVSCLVLLVGAICAALSSLAIKTDLGDAKEIFTQQAYTFEREVAHRFASADAVLTTLVELHHASDDLADHEFAALSRELLRAYPHIQTIAKLSLLRREDRQSLEESMRAGGFPQFQLTERTPEGEIVGALERDIAMPILSLEPFTPEFAQLVGFDAISDAALAPAIGRAIDSGRVMSSEVVEIPHVGRGFFAFKAIYFGYNSPNSVEARRAQVSGLVALFLGADRFFDDTYRHFDRFAVRSFDEHHESGQNDYDRNDYDQKDDEQNDDYIYRQDRMRSVAGPILFEPFSLELPLFAQGKTFVLEVSARPGLEVVRGWFVGIFVVLPALAGTFLILALANHRRRQRQARIDERKLRQNKERFRDFAEIASDWFWATDEQLRFSYLSNQLIEATGLQPKDILGKTRKDLTRFKSNDVKWLQHLTDLEMRRPFRDFRYEYIDPQGKSLWLSISGKPVFSEEDEFLGYRGTGTNITAEVQAETELRKAKEEAEIASRSKSTFLANMSHELRTPLNAIIGFSDLMKRGVSGKIENQRHQEYVDDIYGAGEHLLSIINEILDLAKVEAGNSPLGEDEIDVSEIVQTVCSLLAERAHENRVHLKTEPMADLPYLWADARKLRQILLNLLSNALKFTPPEGTVTVKVSCDASAGYIFHVEDTGIGIAPADIPKALAAFQQIDSELNRKYEGTGLGLPLAKAFVEQHGGSLALKSAVGQGTSAIVVFPPARIRKRPAGDPQSKVSSKKSA
ncbi:ATP-binding protein [Denitrobaculum tricleocarpae]|uniref:histidine kinase n=1 Tax=Denitrobaculum tricleocarpae TaxID=2591009 RepID=A0A545TGE2_9PROT|nr:ATP-binding protein [Denitrobaculum tricleocarpae]TQV76297.1 PAS domain S-box protein [Denitrobaculum tricleocarpae]